MTIAAVRASTPTTHAESNLLPAAPDPTASNPSAFAAPAEPAAPRIDSLLCGASAELRS